MVNKLDTTRQDKDVNEFDSIGRFGNRGLANARFRPILLKNSLLKPPLLSPYFRSGLSGPALPDFSFWSGVSVRSFG